MLGVIKLECEGIDLSGWDPRVREAVRTHAYLEPWHYEAWMRICKGEIEYVQLSCLRHTTEELLSDTFAGRGDFQEAKRLLDLLIELDISPNHHYANLANQYLLFVNPRFEYPETEVV
jgi:pentatricopeptide repeat protein